MPRRPAPSALRLHAGPTPPRNAPKHVMPVAPQPVFCPPVNTTTARSRPTHRSRASSHDSNSSLSPIDIGIMASSSNPSLVDLSPVSGNGNNSDTGFGLVYPSPATNGLGYHSLSSVHLPLTPDSQSIVSGRERSSSSSSLRPYTPPERASPPMIRGPWDHSGSITAKLSLRAEALLQPLKPAALNYH